MTNLPTLNTQNTDDRPLPLIVADRWGFSLQHHEQGGALHYCIQEWIAGLTGESLRKSQDSFGKMRGQLSISSLQLDYLATNGKTYRVPFTDDKGLYIITQNLRATAKRPMLKEIQQYLARAGAFADAARIDPESAVESIESARRAKWERDGKDPQWIANRQNGIYTRKQLTAEIQRILGTGEHMGKLTNTTYRGVLGTDAAGLRERLGLHPGQNPRDYLATLSLYYIGAAEEGARLILSRYGDDEIVSFEDVRKVIEVVAKASGIAAADMAAIVGVDLITGERLLPPGEQE